MLTTSVALLCSISWRACDTHYYDRPSYHNHRTYPMVLTLCSRISDFRKNDSSAATKVVFDPPLSQSLAGL